MTTTIEVNKLSKRYRIGDVRRNQTLREGFADSVRFNRRSRAEHEFTALDNVSFDIDHGEVLGIVGRNGAGKTTLLKILARITQPTSGISRTRGRVAVLLEVGTGFHGELTGRENVYLNGAILGMKRREVAQRFDEIVAFAGVERFIDTPLKHHSSGMQMRLAFSVAAHLQSDIVLIDEVLAVGDAEFQRRCLGKLDELSQLGRSVVFVSHDTGAISRLCNRALWIDGGRVMDDGSPRLVVERYLARQGEQGLLTVADDLSGPVSHVAVAIVDGTGQEVPELIRGEKFDVRVIYGLRQRVPGLDVAVGLLSSQGTVVLDETWSDANEDSALDAPGEHELRVELPGLLASGEYVLRLWIGTNHEQLFMEPLLRLPVAPRPDDRLDWVERSRLIQPAVKWRRER